MLDLLFRDSVTLRRASGRTVRNEVVYKEVLDGAGGPLPIPCRIKRRKGRTITVRGQDITLDAELVCRRSSDNFPEIEVEDVVVAKDGDAYRIVTIDEDEQLFGSAKYLRMGLAHTHLPVEEDKPDA